MVSFPKSPIGKITRRQSKHLYKLIEAYAESRESFYYARDQWNGDTVRDAEKALKIDKENLNKYLAKLTATE